MDILSYFRTGVGRHGDSLGNREEFPTPGMQWMSVGSGVEHAEGGGTPKGVSQQGFQIWLNVPSQHKMDDPIYGTEPPEAIPQELVAPGAKARLLAGPMGDRTGVFETKAFVQVVDFDLEAGAQLIHHIPTGMDCCLLYVYEGEAMVSGQTARQQTIVVFDASSDVDRVFELSASANGPLSAILFAGKRLNEPIAWRGPIVMNTSAEITSTFEELRSGQTIARLFANLVCLNEALLVVAGNFPPVRVPWDYKHIANRPK